MRFRTGEKETLGAAGDLVPVEAIDRTGVVVTSEGTFVRVLRVTPPNPLILSQADRRAVAAGFCHLIGRLRPGQWLQFYLDARPARLADVLAGARRDVQQVAGPPPTREQPARDATALSRWRLAAAMEESLSRHAQEQAAVELSAHVVIPFVPRGRDARATLAGMRRRGLARAPLERGLEAHRRALRDSQAHTDALRSELEALGLPVWQLNGDQVFALLWSRLNPTRADAAGDRAVSGVEVLGELDAAGDRDVAREAALALRGRLAESSVNLKRDRHHVEVDRDVEQVIYAHGTAQQTSMGWLIGAMLTRQPYALSVYVHALDRRRERQRLKLGYRRLFAINRGAEQRGRVPDFDRYAQEREYQQLLTEMAGHDRANVFAVSLYQALRAPGPAPDLVALGEAVDYCAEQLESASDCKVNRGEFRQPELWASSLPLARDVARRVRKYATRNVGDTVPLIGTSCGSPAGLPFAFADPGRTLERIDPYDPAHANHTLLVCGKGGSGKALDVETPLPTPSGWTTMGDLRLGDQLYDDSGQTCRVTGVFDQPPGRPCFEVVFSDSSTIVADADHRWLTHDYRTRTAARYRVTTTKRPLDMLGGASGFRGVTRNRDGRWRAQVQVGDVKHHLGTFADEETAAATAHEARRRLLNRPLLAPSVVTTEEIRRSLRHGKNSNHGIPLTKPLVGDRAELPLAPYTLGVWLGDGSSRHATIYSADPQVIEMIAADGYHVHRYAAPFAHGVSARFPRVADTRRACAFCERSFGPRLAGQRFCSRSCASRSGPSERSASSPACARCGGPLGAQARVTLCRPCVQARTPNSVLRSLGLFGNKHIPTAYLRASEPQRRALLAGLLDADGCVTPRGGVNFDSVNARLANDVRELALSLGYRATLVTKRATLNGRDCGRAYRVCFTTSDDVFRLERKRALLRQRSSRHNPERTRFRYIVDVRPVRSRPVRCITVDSPSHLFLAGEGMIPTHNTMTANVILARAIAHGARAFVIDRAGHYELLTRLIDGAQQVVLGADDSPYAINPWDVPDPGELSREKVAFLISLHALMMGDEGLGKAEIAQLGEAIRAVYARAAVLEDEVPRESMLRDELRAMAEHHQANGAVEIAALVRNLAMRLNEYCDDGTYAYLLDRETTVGTDSPLVVFDTRRCPADVLRPVVFSIMEYVTATVERHWNAHKAAADAPASRFAGRSTMLLDEAWHIVGRPETGEYANDLARRARHLGLVLIVMSQQLSDFDTEHGLALLQNSTMQMLLAQHPNEIAFIRQALQLSEEEARIVGRLKTVKGSHAEMLWINGTRGRGRVAVRVGPTEYWCFTSDQGADAPRREAALQRHDGDVWSAIGELAGHRSASAQRVVAGGPE